jgi:type II secretory pathway predicted ATPase ExeA
MSVSSQSASAALPVPAPPLRAPFADDNSGIDYFRSSYHYRHLSIRVAEELEKGHSFILLSGESAAHGELLERALNEHAASRYRATALRCYPEMDFAQLVHAYNGRLGLYHQANDGGIWTLLSRLMVEQRKGTQPVLVLERAEALDVTCIDEILRFARIDQPHVMPVVLLAGKGFCELLRTPQFAFLKATITSHVSADRLEPQEIGGFIRHQLNEQIDEDLFPSHKLNDIAAASDGDLAIVNRLIREVLASGRSDSQLSAPDPVKSLEISRVEHQDREDETKAHAVLVESAAVSRTTREARRKVGWGMRLGVAFLVMCAALFAIGLRFLDPEAARTLRSRVVSVTESLPAFSASNKLTVVAARPSAPTTQTSWQTQASSVLEGAKTARSSGLAPSLSPSSHQEDGKSKADTALSVVVQSQNRPSGTSDSAANGNTGTGRSAALQKRSAAAERSLITASRAPPSPEPAVAAKHTHAPDFQATVSAPRISAEASRAALGDQRTTSQVQALATPNASISPHVAVTLPQPQRPTAPDPETVMMVERGNALLMTGDIASARSFFARAAATGDPDAEFGLAQSYDPLFLSWVGARGLSGDAAIALGWYRRAAAAGSRAAATRLVQLGQAASPQSERR